MRSEVAIISPTGARAANAPIGKVHTDAIHLPGEHRRTEEAIQVTRSKLRRVSASLLSTLKQPDIRLNGLTGHGGKGNTIVNHLAKQGHPQRQGDIGKAEGFIENITQQRIKEGLNVGNSNDEGFSPFISPSNELSKHKNDVKGLAAWLKAKPLSDQGARVLPEQRNEGSLIELLEGSRKSQRAEFLGERRLGTLGHKTKNKVRPVSNLSSSLRASIESILKQGTKMEERRVRERKDHFGSDTTKAPDLLSSFEPGTSTHESGKRQSQDGTYTPHAVLQRMEPGITCNRINIARKHNMDVLRNDCRPSSAISGGRNTVKNTQRGQDNLTRATRTVAATGIFHGLSATEGADDQQLAAKQTARGTAALFGRKGSAQVSTNTVEHRILRQLGLKLRTGTATTNSGMGHSPSSTGDTT